VKTSKVKKFSIKCNCHNNLIKARYRNIQPWATAGLGKVGTVALSGTQKRGRGLKTCWLFYPRPPPQQVFWWAFVEKLQKCWRLISVLFLSGKVCWLSMPGLLAILLKSIAILLAILNQKSIAIAIPILYFECIAIAILQYFSQYFPVSVSIFSGLNVTTQLN